VDVVEINVIDAHLLQTALEAFAEELGAVVGRDVPLALVVDCEFDAELGGQEDVGATLGVQLEPLSDQDLAVAVAVGCVPIRIAELPGAVQKRQTLFVITGGVSKLCPKSGHTWNSLPEGSVGRTQAHHSEAEGGHLSSRLAERFGGQRCWRCHGGPKEELGDKDGRSDAILVNELGKETPINWKMS